MIKNQELIKDYIKYYEEYHEWNNFNPDVVNNIFENTVNTNCLVIESTIPFLLIKQINSIKCLWKSDKNSKFLN